MPTDKPDIKEAKADLAATEKDIKLLENIVSSLREFIAHSEEDRSGFKLKLMVFEKTLDDANTLAAKIQNFIKTHE